MTVFLSGGWPDRSNLLHLAHSESIEMKQQSKQLSVPAAPIHSYPILYLNFSIIYFIFYWKQLSFQYNKRCEGEWYRKKADANSGLSRH